MILVEDMTRIEQLKYKFNNVVHEADVEKEIERLTSNIHRIGAGLRKCHLILKVNSIKRWLDDLRLWGGLLANQELSHSINKSGGNEDVVIDERIS
ncbi:hypothetical protein H5410_032955 [Solanum commersonii]|uniref:Uncharacterized protein n=1 Tax=Solanum commersonii TaxID=4109 RepID=A0A9J5YMF8_SOLCO|nr:hypothetical protein H5410_032955 [Solanum commersonii]